MDIPHLVVQSMRGLFFSNRTLVLFTHTPGTHHKASPQSPEL